MFSANYTLPEEGEESPFKEIIFTELQREEAAKIIAEYNKVSSNIFFQKTQFFAQIGADFF